jgi:hypothetical protein
MTDAKMTQVRTRAKVGHITTFPLEGGLSASFAVGLGLVIAIEGIILHVWIATRSQPWAWAIAALNVATIAWLWWEYKSTATARLVVSADCVEIDAGSRLRCRVPRSLIAGADKATWRSVPDDFADGWANTAKPLEPNVILTLSEPVRGRLALGITKSVSRIGLRVADPDAVSRTILSGR